MGTRHLIAVKLNGEYKIGQYGQWDGYPSGQGVKVLDFLQKVNLSDFKDRVSKLGIYPPEELDKIPDNMWSKLIETNPELSRETSAYILDMVMKRNDLRLVLAVDFAGDGLFCEWAYVIDFDTNTFEVYKGFSKVMPHPESRFGMYNSKQDDAKDKYWVNFYAGWSLNELPTKEAFLGIDNEDMGKAFDNKESLSLQEVIKGIVLKEEVKGVIQQEDVDFSEKVS